MYFKIELKQIAIALDLLLQGELQSTWAKLNISAAKPT